jgi:glucose dehydrogenase
MEILMLTMQNRESYFGHNKADAGVNAPPISYEIDGTQYIAVAAGGNSIFGFKEGDNILVYKLK